MLAIKCKAAGLCRSLASAAPLYCLTVYKYRQTYRQPYTPYCTVQYTVYLEQDKKNLCQRELSGDACILQVLDITTYRAYIVRVHGWVLIALLFSSIPCNRLSALETVRSSGVIVSIPSMPAVNGHAPAHDTVQYTYIQSSTVCTVLYYV